MDAVSNAAQSRNICRETSAGGNWFEIPARGCTRCPGLMKMPENFKYRETYLAGRPRHGRFDSFALRHPRMDTGRRAKIFAPFDALKGFEAALSAAAQSGAAEH